LEFRRVLFRSGRAVVEPARLVDGLVLLLGERGLVDVAEALRGLDRGEGAPVVDRLRDRDRVLELVRDAERVVVPAEGDAGRLVGLALARSEERRVGKERGPRRATLQ